MRVTRRFTIGRKSPYEGIEFVTRRSEIRNPDGTIVFENDDVQVPSSWSQVATDILAQKYFRRAGVPQVDEDGNPRLDAEEAAQRRVAVDDPPVAAEHGDADRRVPEQPCH